MTAIEPTTLPRIGWIGLGGMGLAMSSNCQRFLTAAGRPPLTYTNRTISRGEPLAALGAASKATVKEVVENSDLIFSCVSNDAAVEETVSQALQATGSLKNKTFCDMSTIHPDTAKKLSEQIVSAGGSFVAAPVFGATAVAVTGNLIIMLAGPEAAVSSILPFCNGVMSKKVMHLGELPEMACMLKIVGNGVLLSVVETLSAAHVLAEKSGLGANALEEFLETMFGGVVLSYSKRITTGHYHTASTDKPSFAIDLAIKDARHAIEVAHKVGAPLPVVELAEKHLVSAKEKKGNWLDSTAIYGSLREEAGLDFDSATVVKRGD